MNALADFEDMFARMLAAEFTHKDLYYGDTSYRDLKDAMVRLRRLRWSDEDESELVALEARAFRLLATLRRVNDDIVADEFDAYLAADTSVEPNKRSV